MRDYAELVKALRIFNVNYDSNKLTNDAAEAIEELLAAVNLPEHGDLISKDDAMNAILGEPPEAHYPSWYAGIVNEIPAIVPSNKEV